ncbi:ABC transporter ATP-binding protein [Brachybacterium sp. NBEC-018]|uniref:metal ABC transporter ATP-binding protein n=1 Tax=Brachybacterium sp. NBEC-018 TaxID=2996004 RepID=UPI0021754997|nr:ABC transporter ATP-binding protein [Brachybacterium sp. NBEC-018]UVY85051.1 ABC transporter ATP-binding protein [Brachybacterium sp. NBEC-018]
MTPAPATEHREPVLSLRGVTMRLGERTLWQDVDLDLARGELVAVLGANGSGKSTLLRAVLGLQPLTGGTATVLGAPVRRGSRRIGLVPQQRLADDGLPLRGRDLVGLGVDGHRWGLPLPRRGRRARVDALLEAVGATRYAEAPVSTLSGGEQQRLRIAQALAGDPDLLLCDEPLLSLDLTHQAMVARLVDEARRRLDLGVLFVTHDINPILGIVDRVLYIAGERFRIGTPAEVLRSEVLSELYGAEVDVLHHRGRVLVAGVPDHRHHDDDAGLAPVAADDHRGGAR